jgi:hypothetical protein
MRFVFAGERALGGGVAGDFKGDGLGAFFGQQGFPFGVGFLDFGGHAGFLKVDLQSTRYKNKV